MSNRALGLIECDPLHLIPAHWNAFRVESVSGSQFEFYHSKDIAASVSLVTSHVFHGIINNFPANLHDS